MLLKISLGLTILVSLATLYFSHFNVAEKINTVTTERDTALTNEQQARDAESKAKKEATQTRNELEAASKELEDTKTQLGAASTRLQDQEKRANKFAEDLTRTTEERNEAQRELAQWRALGLTPDVIRAQNENLQRVTRERDAFTEENKILARNVNQLQAELSRYTGDREPEVKLPAGLKGQVVAVDPNWDFVVLNIGSDQGVLERGRLLVNRNGQLIAKVQITKVSANRSIANLLPEYRQTGVEVKEGDQVLY